VVHTGKGGVGKTTVSAATALAAARSGHRTLVLSADPAHSLGDVLAHRLTGDPAPIEGCPGLYAAQLDTMTRFEQGWQAVRDYLVRVLAVAGMAEVQAEELVAFPGTEDITALLEVQRYAQSGEFDVIVVDCAPSASTLRLLTLPETLRFYADKFTSTPMRLLRTVAAARTAIVSPGDAVRDAVGDLLADLTRARALLADPETTSIRLVLTPEPVVLAEARRLRTALALHGFGIDTVLVNRVLPADAGGAYLDAWVSAQADVLAEIDESFTDLAVRRVPATPGGPVGPEALSELAAEVFAGDPLARHGAPAGLAVTSRDGGGYRLELPLPHVTRGELSLARAGDDLVITLDGQRRRLALPSVLRRCAVTGATLVGVDANFGAAHGALAVDFEPDPRRWPAALKGALPSALPDAPRSADVAEPVAAVGG
jgi:arsenite-transporting ATPase